MRNRRWSNSMSQLNPDSDNNSGSKSPESAGEQQSSQTDLDDIYQRTEQLLRRALTADHSTLIDAPPSSGKTTGIFRVISETDGRFTYLTKREDLYEQAADLARDFGVTPTIIPSPIPGEIPNRKYCPSFDQHSPHYDPEAISLYKHGLRAGPLHDLLDLTCTPDCPYVQFWNNFDADEHDVLIGHDKHAYISSVVENRIVIIDEFPGNFEQSFEDAPKMVGRFLKATDGMPFDDWDDLIMADYSHWETACEWFAANGVEVDATTIIETDETTRYHSITPFLVWAVLEEHKGDNGFGIPWFNLVPSETIPTAFGRELANNRRVAVNHEDRSIHVLTQPTLGDARCLIGLDGTPLPEQWELATGEDLHRLALFKQDDDLNTYIHDTLDITIARASDHLKPYHGGHITPNLDEAILYGVEVKEGQKPALIAPNKALDKYRDAGILHRAKRSMNYAQVLSSNAFAGESVGVIHGSPHPGNAILKRWAAYFGAHIEGEGRGMAKTYGDFGDRLYHHFVHNQVLQAILRFGRGESEATVYVNTAAIPDRLDIDVKVNPKLFDSPSKRTIADHLREQGDDGATKAELAEPLDVSERTIENILYEFRDRDLVEGEQQSDWPYKTVFRWLA